MKSRNNTFALMIGFVGLVSFVDRVVIAVF